MSDTIVFILISVAKILIKNISTYMDPEGTHIFKPFKTRFSVDNCLKAFKMHTAISEFTTTILEFLHQPPSIVKLH